MKPSLHPFPYRPSLLLALCCSLGAAGCKNLGEDKARLPPLAAGTTPVASTQAGASSASTASPSGAAASEPKDPSVDAAGVLHLTGNTEAHRRSYVSVASRGGGILARMAVREGDFVKQGALIAQLDASDIVIMNKQAEAGLAVAEAQFRGAERERKRLEALAKDKAIPGMQLDMATTGFEQATAGLAASQAQLAQARKALGDMTVRAPYAGLVGARLKNEGEWVSTMPPAPLIELVEITPLDLYIQAPEHLLDKINVGDEVTAHFNSVSRSAKGKVARIVPIVRPPARAFLVIAEFPNEDLALHPGLFAEVDLVPQGAAAAEPEEAPADQKLEAQGKPAGAPAKRNGAAPGGAKSGRSGGAPTGATPKAGASPSKVAAGGVTP
jgi:RND family efflux transporter MFP subunit